MSGNFSFTCAFLFEKKLLLSFGEKIFRNDFFSFENKNEFFFYFEKKIVS